MEEKSVSRFVGGSRKHRKHAAWRSVRMFVELSTDLRALARAPALKGRSVGTGCPLLNGTSGAHAIDHAYGRQVENNLGKLFGVLALRQSLCGI
jgi:hypothetical protein